MATIKFYYRSIKENASITLRLMHQVSKEETISIYGRTQFRIDKSTWNETRKKTIKDAHLRNKKIEIDQDLTKLENFILLNTPTENKEINKNWLTDTINEYYNPIKEHKNTVEYWIQHFIDNSHTFDNPKGGIGLGKSRVDSYRALKKTLILFNSKLTLLDCNKKTFDNLKKWLIKESYAPTTLYKKQSDLKTICIYAQSEGMEVSNQIHSIKIKKGNPYEDDMDVITLTELDINKVEKLNLTRLSLINARKWLILACYTGQRGQRLLKNIKQENFKPYKDDLIIRFQQSKGNKTVTIPVLPKTRDIYNNGLPYEISLQKLNKYFKELGEKAELNEPTIGTIKESIKNSKGKSIQRNVKKEREKWRYICSHIGRRTFATIHYNKLATTLIMRVTGHGKESDLLTYINQKNDDHLDVFFNYYKTKEEEKETQIIEMKTVNK
jgi:integrase